MSNTYKAYVKQLEVQVASFSFMNDNHLILLKNSLDLSILHNEIWERSLKDNELVELLNTVKKAQESYDIMFAKYNHQRVLYEHLALETKKLMNIVRAYENEEELLNREL